MPQNINSVVLTGNLTQDPEQKDTSGGGQVCRMRIATNTRVKRGDEWMDKANYVDVVAFGRTAENCSKYLSKGRPIAVSGRLDWSEWTAQDGGKRQGLSVIANDVQFLGGNEDGGGGSSGGSSSSQAPPPVSDGDFAPASAADDDIPF